MPNFQNKCNTPSPSHENVAFICTVNLSRWVWARILDCVCENKMCVVFLLSPNWACSDKACFWAQGQLLDTVQPHTYSNSLIHKSHRLTLGSPRCPDRWEQKPREESRQEEEEVSQKLGQRGRGVLCSAHQARWHMVLRYSLSLSSTLFIVSHGLSITEAQSH